MKISFDGRHLYLLSESLEDHRRLEELFGPFRSPRDTRAAIGDGRKGEDRFLGSSKRFPTLEIDLETDLHIATESRIRKAAQVLREGVGEMPDQRHVRITVQPRPQR